MNIKPQIDTIDWDRIELQYWYRRPGLIYVMLRSDGDHINERRLDQCIAITKKDWYRMRKYYEIVAMHWNNRDDATITIEKIGNWAARRDANLHWER